MQGALLKRLQPGSFDLINLSMQKGQLDLIGNKTLHQQIKRLCHCFEMTTSLFHGDLPTFLVPPGHQGPAIK